MKVNVNKQTVDEIKKVIADNPGQGSCIRFYVAGIGWGGPSFGIALDEQKENDLYYEEHGQGFLMEKDFHDQFGDFVLEYTVNGYVVQPENQQASDCGSCSSCG